MSSDQLENLKNNIEEPVILVQDLEKVYKLYQSPKYRLFEALHPLGKKFHKDFHALRNVSFSVQKGETLGIIGKNGSGKSTLLKILSGVLTPTSGSVSVKGKVSTLLELGAGFNPELSGMENIFFYGSINGIKRKDMEKYVEPILEFADIGEYIYQPVKSYSSGMFVRLAFAAAVQIEPDILIVDEALAVGDIFFQQKCSRRMLKMREKGVTILFVSHDMSSVRNICSKVIFLKNGTLNGIGVSEKMIAEYYKESDAIDNYSPDRGLQVRDSFRYSDAISLSHHSGIDLNKYVKNSIIDSVFENEYVSILAISILNENEELCMSYKIGEWICFAMIIQSRTQLSDIHCNLVMKNKYGQITFAGGSYTKKLNALNCNENHIGLFRLNAKLNLEAGSYTFEISIGQQLADQLNKGFSIMETEKLGPIIIHWDYEKNVPPFYGSFGLDYKVEWE